MIYNFARNKSESSDGFIAKKDSYPLYRQQLSQPDGSGFFAVI
jgi:hypothetical protein